MNRAFWNGFEKRAVSKGAWLRATMNRAKRAMNPTAAKATDKTIALKHNKDIQSMMSSKAKMPSNDAYVAHAKPFLKELKGKKNLSRADVGALASHYKG